MNLETLRQQVCCRLIIGSADDREKPTRSARSGLLRRHEVANHVVSGGHTFDFLDRCELRKLPISAGRRIAKRTNTLGDQI